MTYTLTLTPYLAAQLAACCLHAGMDTANLFAARLTRHSEPAAPAATPEAAAVEEPAAQPHLYPRPPRYPRPADGRLCGTAPEPEPPPVPPCDPNRFFEL